MLERSVFALEAFNSAPTAGNPLQQPAAAASTWQDKKSRLTSGLIKLRKTQEEVRDGQGLENVDISSGELIHFDFGHPFW